MKLYYYLEMIEIDNVKQLIDFLDNYDSYRFIDNFYKKTFQEFYTTYTNLE